MMTRKRKAYCGTTHREYHFFVRIMSQNRLSLLLSTIVLLVFLLDAVSARTVDPLYNESSCSLTIQQYLHSMRGSTMQAKKQAVAHAQIDFFEATKCLAHPPSTDAEKELSASAYAQLCKDRLGETTLRLEQAENDLAAYQGELEDMAPSLVYTCQSAILSTNKNLPEPLRIAKFFYDVTKGVLSFLVDAYTPAALEFHKMIEGRAKQLHAILQAQKFREASAPRKSHHNKVLRAEGSNNTTGLVRLCNFIVDVLKEMTPLVVQEYVAMFAVVLALPLIAAVMIAVSPMVLGYLVVVEIAGFFVKTILLNGVLRPLMLTIMGKHPELGLFEVLWKMVEDLFAVENAVAVATVALLVGVCFSVCALACLPPAVVLLDFFQAPIVYEAKQGETGPVATGENSEERSSAERAKKNQ